MISAFGNYPVQQSLSTDFFPTYSALTGVIGRVRSPMAGLDPESDPTCAFRVKIFRDNPLFAAREPTNLGIRFATDVDPAFLPPNAVQ